MKKLLPLFSLALASFVANAAPIKVLLVDGQNNHDWKLTSPEFVKILNQPGIFKVDVATSPDKGQDMSGFHPDFSAYQVVVSNYNGEPWSEDVQKAFEKYIHDGGGFVSIHAADNAFPAWNAYNDMIAVGGWNGRDEKSGPMLRLREGKWIGDTTPGGGGHHGDQHEFKVTTRAPEHPIMKGLPSPWLHGQDELYDSLRGPAKNVTVLASAFSDKTVNGTGQDEPMLMTIVFGKGRVFHTTMGHSLPAIRCVGFATTLQRGTEWAATGKVTQKVPENFPTAGSVSVIPAEKK